MASVNQVPSPDEKQSRQPELEPEQAISSKPFVVPERAGSGAGKDKTRLIVLGMVGAVILFVALFAMISTKGKMKSKDPKQAGKPSLGRVVAPSTPGQIIPSENAAAPIAAQAKNGALDAHDIERTRVASLTAHNPSSATVGGSSPAPTRSSSVKQLGQINQFQPPDTDPQHLRNWAPEPYQDQDHGQNATTAQATQEARQEQEEYGKASMVFVAHQSTNSDKASSLLRPQVDNFGLESGYHVGADSNRWPAQH